MRSRTPFIILHAGNLYLAQIKAGVTHLLPGDLDVGSGGIASPGYWNMSDGKPLFDEVATFDTKGNQACFDVLVRLCAPPAAVDSAALASSVAATVGSSITDQLAALGVPDVDEEKIAEALSATLGAPVAKAVAAELSVRLAQ